MNSNSQSQNAIPVSCDECQNVFSISGFETESVNVDQYQNVIRTFFDCPSCNHSYTCYYTDEHIRSLQDGLNYLYEQQAKRFTAERVVRINGLHEQVKQAMTTLMRVIEGE